MMSEILYFGGISIPEATLYNWRKALRKKGAAVPSKKTSPEQWPAQTKLAVVAETYTMTEHELSTYCRSKGLYPEQIYTWREECLHGFRSRRLVPLIVDDGFGIRGNTVALFDANIRNVNNLTPDSLRAVEQAKLASQVSLTENAFATESHGKSMFGY